MKKLLMRIGILFLVFVAGGAATIFFMNQEITDNKGDMDYTTLPEVLLEVDGVMVNRMCGYKQKMQVDFTREGLTPLDTSKTLNFVINPHEAEVKSLSYEVRTSDGSRVLENKKLKQLEEREGYLYASTALESSMLMNQEYSLEISLETAAGTLYYYNRVIQRSGGAAGEYVKFAKTFSQNSMDNERADDIYDYIESESTSTNINYANIDIHSSWTAITWSKLQPKIVEAAIPTIREINETTGSVTLEYLMSLENEEGQTEEYYVTEFYRMRYSQAEMELLDFNRSVQQVFDGSLPVVTTEGLLLGIRDRDVTYLTNEDGTIAAFVQLGDLWTYAPDSDKLVRIFTFRQEENSDFRDIRPDHDIKIIRVSQSGDVDFVLYGYMNRGPHEGYSGISVCHYDSEQKVVEEKVFLPCTESFEFLKEDINKLSYVNHSDALFLLSGGNLYEVDIEQRTYHVLEEGITQGEFFVSESNAHAAWMAKGEDEAGQMKEIDFDTGEIRLMAPEEGQKIEILGFFNEDVIYGMALKENIFRDARGNEKTALSIIQIQDFEGNIKKTYQSEYLITDVTVGSTLLEIQLGQREGESFQNVKTDNIMNGKKAATDQISLEFTYDDRRETLVCMAFEESIDDEKPLVVKAKIRLTDTVEILLETTVPEEEVYYVYALGGLKGIFDNPADAIIQADQEAGVVLNRRQQYVWERGNRRDSIQLTLENIPQVFLDAPLDTKVIQEALKETGKALDLTGCSLDSILYQVSAQRPVVVKTGENETKLIVGYDAYNTWLYTPATGETQAFAMDESEELFEKYGNVFVTYMEILE